MEYYTLDSDGPWGDYGYILVGGMTGYLPRSEGRLQLLRTGPFVPPMAVPGGGDLVIVESMIQPLLQVAGVSGTIPVVKRKIVRCDWTEHIDGELRPFSGDPEDVIIQGVHDCHLAEEMAEMHEVVLLEDGAVDITIDYTVGVCYSFAEAPRLGYQLFKARTPSGDGVIVTTDAFFSNLDGECRRWLRLSRIEPAAQGP